MSLNGSQRSKKAAANSISLDEVAENLDSVEADGVPKVTGHAKTAIALDDDEKSTATVGGADLGGMDMIVEKSEGELHVVGHHDDALGHDRQRAGICCTSYNMINSILGPGLLPLPFAMQEAGLIMGVAMMITTGFLTNYSVRLIVRLGLQHDANSYPQLLEKAYKAPGFYVVGTLMGVLALGAMATYVSIMADVFPAVFRVFSGGKDNFFTSRVFAVSFGLMIFLPLCLFRNVARLAKFSAFATGCMAYVFFIVWFYSPIFFPREKEWATITFMNIKTFFPALGIMSGAFVCHHNSFLLFRSLREPTLKRWNRATHLSIFVACSVLAGVGAGGFLVYSPNVRGDILNNFPHRNEAHLARLAAAVVLSLTYPLECLVAREIVEAYLWRWGWSRKIFKLEGRIMSPTSMHFGVTLACVLFTTLVGWLFENAALLFGLVGSFCSISIAYILPSLSALKLEPGKLLSWKRVPAIGLGVFGLTAMVSATGITFYNMVTGHYVEGPHGA